MQTPSVDPNETFDPDQPAHMPGTGGGDGADMFFDSAGLLWMLACLTIAFAAGHWIPRLSEPGGWSATVHGAVNGAVKGVVSGALANGNQAILALGIATQPAKAVLPATPPASAAAPAPIKIQAGLL